jgi:hypothetical protein
MAMIARRLGPRTSSRWSGGVRVTGSDIRPIAKIEKPQAADNAEAIIRAPFGGLGALLGPTMAVPFR